MRIAIISITKNGLIISEKIKRTFQGHGCTRYALEKYGYEGAIPFSDLKGLTAELFGKFDAIVFVSAVGIAVRMIAPHIVSKTTDPAVIAVDEGGRFAVSLLSGHLGGANILTAKIVEATGAVPVITTATDVSGKFSPDSFAKANGLHIVEMELAKAVAAAVVNGDKVGFYSDYPCKNQPEGIFADSEIGICVSADMNKNPFKQTLHLVPKNIVIGAGCKKNTDPKAFSSFISSALKSNGLDLCRVAELRTIDKKRDEAAILEFCRKNAVPVRFLTAEELMAVEGDFFSSDFVMKTVGADNVCERSAASGGRLIVRKSAKDGMTFAAAERDIDIDFEREIL